MSGVRAAACAVALAAAIQLAGIAQPRSITLYLPAFEGPDALGANVATILNLQIWQTFRKAPTPNPQRLDFGAATVSWDRQPLATQSHDGAEQAMKANGADLTLWGKVWRYNDGVLTQSYLTIPARTRRVWEVALADGPIGLDLPRLRYEFRSFALARDVVETYSSPTALKLYASATSTSVVGVVGDRIDAKQQDSGAALVESGGKTGWVHLPSLSTSRSEVVDFVGGVIRVLRADWSGAGALLQRVLTTPGVSATLKVDAHLLHGLALERSGASGLDELKAAYALNPYDKATVSYLMLGYVAAIGRAPANTAARAALVADAQKLAKACQFLFPAKDPWFARISAAIR